MQGRSSRVLARVGAGAAALAAVLLTAGPAFADNGKIQFTNLPNGHLGVLFTALGLTSGESIDLNSVKVTVNDQIVTGTTAKLVTDTSTQAVRQTMLTIDVSGSMSQPIGTSSTRRIDAAKQAAQSYLKGVPTDVSVGLVTFQTTASVVIAPTTDHAKVSAAIASLSASNGSTALYDGVQLAQTTLRGVPNSLNNILLLGDGANDINDSRLGTTLADLKDSKVSLSAVSIGSDAAGTKQLQALSTAGGGVTVTADSVDTLTAFFNSAANAQANQIIVDVPVPPNVAGTSQQVLVVATAGGRVFSDQAVAVFPAAATSGPTGATGDYGPVAVATPTAGITGQPWFLPLAVGAVGVGLFALLAIALSSTDRENQTAGRLRRRLSRYSLSSRQEPAPSNVATSGALGQSQVARSAVEFAGRVVQRRDIGSGLGARLEAAGIPLKPAEWLLVHLGIAIGAGLVLTLLSGFALLPTLIGLGLGLLLPFVYLSMKESRRKADFANQLPDTLQLLSGSLAAGYSLPQAVDTVVRESSGPMAAELNRALVETRLGVPIEDALDTVARRMDSVDFQWVVMAIRIQREVGGNLAEVLSSVAATMRERERLRRQVQVLSAEGRLSAIILGALPLLFVLYLVLVRPNYIGQLVTSPLGIVMIVVGVSLLVGGAFWLRKVVKVEV